SSGTPTEVSALRSVLFAAFVVGLGLSISLSESSLLALTLLWLWRLRDPAVRAEQSWPLLGPMVAFAAATVLSALASGHPLQSLVFAKGLLLGFALYVTEDALASTEHAQRFVSGPPLG